MHSSSLGWRGGGRMRGMGPKWRKLMWEPVEIIRVIRDCGPNKECEGWRQGSGGWVELDVASIRGVGTAA